jgi:hypothetical protein
VTDGHDGVRASVGQLFAATARQRCLVHKQRNVYGLRTSWLSPTFDDAGGIGLMAVHRAMAAEEPVCQAHASC